jgi:ABC-type phosphate transport system substrate-binding protein
MIQKLQLTLLFIAVTSLTAIAADDVVLVANPSVSASDISADDLKLVFLGTKNSVSGSTVEPVLAEKGSAHEIFLKKYVGKSDTAYRMYLKSLVFAGKATMPKSLSDDAAVISYVAKTKGAIGYVSASAATGGVKKLDIK